MRHENQGVSRIEQTAVAERDRVPDQGRVRNKGVADQVQDGASVDRGEDFLGSKCLKSDQRKSS